MSTNIDNLKVFGANVRTLRNKQGLSLNGLARKSVLHRNYISDLELGKRNISFETIKKKNGDGLNVPIKELFIKR